MTNLDKEEKDLLDSYEQGEWKVVADVESEIERFREYASATVEKLPRTATDRFRRFRQVDSED